MLDTVIGNRRNALASELLLEHFRDSPLNGTLYLGYPILASVDTPVLVDSLLTCVEHGVVVFVFSDVTPTDDFRRSIERQLDAAYVAVEQLLKRIPELVERRKLVTPIHTVAFMSALPEGVGDVSEIAVTAETLQAYLSRCETISPSVLKYINAAFQRVSTIKPPQKRLNVQRSTSRGAVIRQIEKNIANLDQWQKKAAIEAPDGPQRIRGLAGSGKTIVLALKAAYLHAANPDWSIAVTFHTRSLYQQFRDLVRRFCFEHMGDEPNWEKLKVIHSWGSERSPGFYSTIAQAAGVPPLSFLAAKQQYGFDKAFEGICGDLLAKLRAKPAPALFDAVLIDEAQDFPQAFFELAWLSSKPPHRVVFAYDELQNLTDYTMAPPSELFGKGEGGHARCGDLADQPGRPKRDLVLPVCYRNTQWALTVAHALGFGVYRAGEMVQFFNDAALWSAIGYDVVSGSLDPGSQVVLRRNPDATPPFFRELISESDAVVVKEFADADQQATWIAGQIKDHLTTDELQHRDILIIFPDPLTVQKKAVPLLNAMSAHDIPVHIAGVTSSVDEIFVDGSVAITGIFRAKGNEAPMVYVVHAEYCHAGLELIKRRNTLFTAITRSRAWVRVCGIGPSMAAVAAEIQSVRQQNYQLAFRVPIDVERLRWRNRDRPQSELSKVSRAQAGLSDLLQMMEAGELDLDNLPPDLVDRMKALVSKRGQQ